MNMHSNASPSLLWQTLPMSLITESAPLDANNTHFVPTISPRNGSKDRLPTWGRRQSRRELWATYFWSDASRFVDLLFGN
jgi:hypothetical protein